jgi:hypothetical protein
MNTVAARKCVRHPGREAVARCPSCGEHFCRECVVEHRGILLCAACLARAAATAPQSAQTEWRRAGELALTAASVLLLWVAFYTLGQFLKFVPARVHEGTVWRREAGS